MVKEGVLEAQEQRLVGNGLLQVTVAVLITDKWYVDNESPYHERLFFLDGVSLDGIGTPFYVRAWWEIPLSDLNLFEVLDKVQLNSFLAMSSRCCTIESAEDFNTAGEEGQEQLEGGPEFCLGMKAPTLKHICSRNMEPRLEEFVKNIYMVRNVG